MEARRRASPKEGSPATSATPPSASGGTLVKKNPMTVQAPTAADQRASAYGADAEYPAGLDQALRRALRRGLQRVVAPITGVRVRTEPGPRDVAGPCFARSRRHAVCARGGDPSRAWGLRRAGSSCSVLFSSPATSSAGILGVSSQSSRRAHRLHARLWHDVGAGHAWSSACHVRIDVLIQKLPLDARACCTLLVSALLMVFAGFFAWGAIDLVAESWLFRATDISLLRDAARHSARPVGLRARHVLPARRDDASSRACCSCWRVAARTRGTHAPRRAPTTKRRAEALAAAERPSARRRQSSTMIAIVFLWSLLRSLIGGASLFGGRAVRPPADRRAALALVGLFASLFFAGGHLRRRGARRARPAGGLRFSDRPFWNFIGETIWGPVATSSWSRCRCSC